MGEWIQTFGATVSGVVWVDKRYMYLWLVNSCLEYHRPIITNACPPKQSQKSLHPKLVPILPRVSEVGYNSKKIYIQASPQLTVSLKHSVGTFFKNLMAPFYKFVFPMITGLWITVGLKKSTDIIRFTHSLFVILDELIKCKLFF